MQGVEVDLYKLYNVVVSMGGWQRVSITEKWYDVLHALGIGDDLLVAEHAVKLLYMRLALCEVNFTRRTFRYLSKYEQTVLHGDNDDHDNDILGSRNRSKGFSSLATSDNPISTSKYSGMLRPLFILNKIEI